MTTALLLISKRAVVINYIAYNEYYWRVNDIHYRVLFCPHDKNIILQKHQNNLWYTYATPSQEMQKALNFQNFAFINPSALLDQTCFRVWVADINCWSVEKIDNKKTYYTNIDKQQIINKKNISEVFSHFEDPRFIRQSTDGGHTSYSLYLERYDLTFKSTFMSFYTADERYMVSIPKPNLFGTGLLLTDVNFNQSRFLIIPVQLYYLEKNNNNQPISIKSGTQYCLVHDLSNYLANNYLFGKEK